MSISSALPPMAHITASKPESTSSPRRPPPASLAPPHTTMMHPASIGNLLSAPDRPSLGEDRPALPSIHGLLGEATSPIHHPPPPTSAPAPASHTYATSPASTSLQDHRAPSFHDGQPTSHTRSSLGPPHSPFSSTSLLNAPAPYAPAPRASTTQRSPTEYRPSYAESRPLAPTAQSTPKIPAWQPPRTAHSPSSQSRPLPPYPSYPPLPSSSHAPPSHEPRSIQPASHYSQRGPAYSPSTPTQPGPHHAHPTPTASSYPAPKSHAAQPAWPETRLEEKKLHRASLAPYGESVKRHLESFDFIASLNEMAEGSGRIADFSKIYRQRAHENSRMGMTPQSMPRLEQVDELLKHSEMVHTSLQRMRDVVYNYQRASIMETPQDARHTPLPGYEHDTASAYGDDNKSAGGFAGGDSKKPRRGRAAPPGRCHSCNRAETPEWRRGPDGARTLCNACGLHYAKLTRKMGGKQAMMSSNLRPKSVDPVSSAAA